MTVHLTYELRFTARHSQHAIVRKRSYSEGLVIARLVLNAAQSFLLTHAGFIVLIGQVSAIISKVECLNDA